MPAVPRAPGVRDPTRGTNYLKGFDGAEARVVQAGGDRVVHGVEGRRGVDAGDGDAADLVGGEAGEGHGGGAGG